MLVRTEQHVHLRGKFSLVADTRPSHPPPPNPGLICREYYFWKQGRVTLLGVWQLGVAILVAIGNKTRSVHYAAQHMKLITRTRIGPVTRREPIESRKRTLLCQRAKTPDASALVRRLNGQMNSIHSR